MKSISEFFKKINDTHTKEIALRSSIQSSIKEITDIDIPVTSISVKTGIVSFKSIPHAARSVIYINKQKIINQINNNLTQNKISEIY